jgi:hypothetical protein
MTNPIQATAENETLEPLFAPRISLSVRLRCDIGA